jgi:hypothetical protein
MNIITTTDGRALMALQAASMGGLEGLRDDVRVARWALDMARLERPSTWRYRGVDAIGFRRQLIRRISRCLAALRQAEMALRETQERVDLRRLQNAQPAGLTAAQAGYCIEKLTRVETWLDRLSLSKPADDDYHARLLMRNEVSFIRDLLIKAAVQPISISAN